MIDVQSAVKSMKGKLPLLINHTFFYSPCSLEKRRQVTYRRKNNGSMSPMQQVIATDSQSIIENVNDSDFSDRAMSAAKRVKGSSSRIMTSRLGNSTNVAQDSTDLLKANI